MAGRTAPPSALYTGFELRLGLFIDTVEQTEVYDVTAHQMQLKQLRVLQRFIAQQRRLAAMRKAHGTSQPRSQKRLRPGWRTACRLLHVSRHPAPGSTVTSEQLAAPTHMSTEEPAEAEAPAVAAAWLRAGLRPLQASAHTRSDSRQPTCSP